MTAKARYWCPGKVRYATPELAERSRRGIVFKDAARGRLRPGLRLVCYFCDVCQAFHLGHERVDVPPAMHDETPAIDPKPSPGFGK